MVFIRSLALAASILGFASAAPALVEARQEPWAPGTLNNTREFYITLKTVTEGLTKYDGWPLQAYHTGAGFADPVFVEGAGSRAYLNGTNLQFDVSPYPFSVHGFPSDSDSARWESVGISTGYGSGVWVNEGSAGLQVTQEGADGWLVCEWSHGINAPQLFQMIKGLDGDADGDAYNVPSSCARALLFTEWI